jgi:hypothetical protein
MVGVQYYRKLFFNLIAKRSVLIPLNKFKLLEILFLNLIFDKKNFNSFIKILFFLNINFLTIVLLFLKITTF